MAEYSKWARNAKQQQQQQQAAAPDAPANPTPNPSPSTAFTTPVEQSSTNISGYYILGIGSLIVSALAVYYQRQAIFSLSWVQQKKKKKEKLLQQEEDKEKKSMPPPQPVPKRNTHIRPMD